MTPADVLVYVGAVRAAVGAPIFTGPHNVSLTGLRRPWPPGGAASDRFDDVIVATSSDADGRFLVVLASATTDPGRAYLRDPVAPRGTAIVIPGTYRGSHAIGLHRGASGARPALVQVGLLEVWRDRDRDGNYDPSSAEPAPASCRLNIHDGGDAARVGRWSAGCQVVRLRRDMAAILEMVDAQRRAGRGGSVSYTLVDVGALTGAASSAAGALLDAAA